MGCGASSSSEPPSREGSAGKARSEERDADDQKLVSNGEVKTRHLHLKEDNNNGSLDSLNRKKKATRNQVDPLVPVSQTPVPKAIAFDISLDNDINKILYKKPPRRLTGLEPLDNAPKLTAEALQEKMRLAEEKRKRQLEKKRAASRKSSRLRKRLTEAKMIDDKASETSERLEERQRSASRNREAKQRDLEEKRLQREERARRAKKKSQRLKHEDEDLDLEIERDDRYNDNDSWMDDGDRNRADERVYSSGTERVYSGRESPQKSYRARGAAGVRGASAVSSSTTDSFDHAFQRDPERYARARNDDFFDS